MNPSVLIIRESNILRYFHHISHTVRQILMLLAKSWRWWTTWNYEMLNSPDTLRILLAGFAFITWSMASKCIVLGHPDLYLIIDIVANRAKFLQTSGYCTVVNYAFTFCKMNISDFLHGVIAHFELVKRKFLNWSTFNVPLCRFQITHAMKQCTTCQRTNYNDPPNQSGYLLLFDLL